MKSGTDTGYYRFDLAKLRNDGDLWEHPDDGIDLVAFRMLHSTEIDYTQYPFDGIASRDLFAKEEIKATDRVVFVSLLLNFMGTTRNFPVFRDGMISLIPTELVPDKYSVGSRLITTQQEFIMIDATATPGASGSPVFHWPTTRIKGGTFQAGGTAWLVGIVHAFYQAPPRRVAEVAPTSSKMVFAENSGIALATPSWRLLELLGQDKLKNRVIELTKEK